MKKSIVILSLAIMPLFFSACNSDNSQLNKENQKLKTKIERLESLLTQKLMSLCDSSTPAQKLKQLEFNEYELGVWRVKDNNEIQALKDKEAAELKAYKEKEDRSAKRFGLCSEAKARLVKELQKDDPKNFKDYAVLNFLYESCSYDYNLFKSKRAMEESVPAIKKFVSLSSGAWNNYDTDRKEYDQEYNKKCMGYNLVYQMKLRTINDGYEKCLSNKKRELGL